MAQTIEAQAFLKRLNALPKTPGVDLTPAVKPSLDDEEALRRLFATDRTNSRLDNPLVGLVDVFGEGTERIKTIHARHVKDEADLNQYYLMPLDDETRRKDGQLAMAASMDDFKARWAIFSEGALSQLLDWNNVLVAGGSVLACLAPLPDDVLAHGSKRAIRKYFHSVAYPASDVDLFIYGLDPKEAEAKCAAIYAAVRDSVPWEVTAVRTKNALSIHCQYPYRPVQIVLRLYHSPAEILAGFDVDSSCVAYNGKSVYAAPRAIMALMTQSNQASVDRRSPSYEVRLAKYASRGFEIHVPDLRRDDLDPTIFERALTRVTGLARLLVLERLSTQDARDGFLQQRRTMRGRPGQSNRSQRRDQRLRGDLKTAAEFGGLAMSEYDSLFHIPYGPGIDARKIEKMIYSTDLGLNSTFNPKNKGRRLHRHPAFFGTMEEAIEDCCEHCCLPITDEEKALFEKEQEQFVTGRMTFILDNPGRQSMTGSFRPIDTGEWSEQAYISKLTKLFTLIAAHDRAAVNEFLKRNADAINTRDHLGRSPIQFALLCSAEDICLDLIQQGARMSARLVDGRSSLHLAAQMDVERVVVALLEKSAKNKVEAEEKEKAEKAKAALEGKDVKMKDSDEDERVRDSSEDDWTAEEDEASEEEDYKEAAKKVDAAGVAKPVDEEDALDDPDEPDILDIDAPDWDQCLTPLGFAIVAGALSVVRILVAAGADCKTPRKLQSNYYSTTTFYPLTLTSLTTDEAVASQIAEHLVTAGGASCAAADSATVTVFHRLVALNKVLIVKSLMRVDPTAKVACKFLWTGNWRTAVHPLATAFGNGNRSMAIALLAFSTTRAFVDQETYDRSMAANPTGNRYGGGKDEYLQSVIQPLEASIINHNELYRLVVALEPDSITNAIPKDAWQNKNYATYRRSLLDYLESAVKSDLSTNQENIIVPQPISSAVAVLNLSQAEISAKSGWEAESIALERAYKDAQDKQKEANRNTPDSQAKKEQTEREQKEKTSAYFQEVIDQFKQLGAKTWNEIFPDEPYQSTDQLTSNQQRVVEQATKLRKYMLHTEWTWTFTEAGAHLYPLYDELFEAVWKGDNERVKAMCLPPDDTTQAPTQKDLLQITVQCRLRELDNNYSPGYTPLFVALRARKWDTAKLIVEIMVAQQETDDDSDDEAIVPGTGKIKFDDDDDDDDGDDSDAESDDSEATQKKLGFDTIAAKFHTISVKVKPETILNYTAQIAKDKEFFSGDPLTLAIRENDTEAFGIIWELRESVDMTPNHDSILQSIISNDSPGLLQEYIRRSGQGLSISEDKVDSTKESGDATKDAEAGDDDDDDDDGEFKMYLGLNYHGKKRKDLAKSADPSAPYASDAPKVPMVWRAAQAQKREILNYLASPAATEAYQHYATNNTTRLARRIKEALAKPGQLSQLLGFNITPIGESAVLATVSGSSPEEHLDTLKTLMSLNPRQTADGIGMQVMTQRFTPLLALCANRGQPETFDWLMANGADPLVREQRGWNILHLIMYYPCGDLCLLMHVLEKLPAETMQALMVQQSRRSRNTPFALAVKTGHIKIVRLLVEKYKTAILPCLALRDFSGATPLHSAILKGYSQIVSLLVSASPPDALYAENGVGATPLELAKLADLNVTLRSQASASIATSSIQLRGNVSVTPIPGIQKEDEEDVVRLRKVIEEAKSAGAFSKKPEVQAVLEGFADRTENDFATFKSQQVEDVDMDQKNKGPTKDSSNPQAVLSVFSKAVVPIHQRSLVHLHDVQQAVLNAIEMQPGNQYRRPAPVGLEDGGEEKEKDEDDVRYLVSGFSWAEAEDTC